jgi:hypothetical protein
LASLIALLVCLIFFGFSGGVTKGTFGDGAIHLERMHEIGGILGRNENPVEFVGK